MMKTNREVVETMSVEVMRREAPKHGIKNPSQYKRAILSEKLIEALDSEDKEKKEAENAEFDLEKLSKKELQALCKQYNVASHHNHKSDSRTQMIEALKAHVA